MSSKGPVQDFHKVAAKSKAIVKTDKRESRIVKAVAKEKFTLFYTSESPFSQFYPSKFTIDGNQFTCAEMSMMYHKAMLFKDEEVAAEILTVTKPRSMKALGRKVRNFDQAVWDAEKFSIVKKGSLAKFSQNPDLLEILLATDGTTLVEASPRDRIWGIGLDASNPLAHDRASWRGQNLLGTILTEVREELKQRK